MTKERVWEECEHGIWLSPCPICKDIKEAALLGAFLHRWEEMLDMLKTIKEFKDLAIKLKDKIPPEWWDEDFVFMEV